MNYEDIMSLWLLRNGCRVRKATERVRKATEEDKTKKFDAEAEDFQKRVLDGKTCKIDYKLVNPSFKHICGTEAV